MFVTLGLIQLASQLVTVSDLQHSIQLILTVAQPLSKLMRQLSKTSSLTYFAVKGEEGILLPVTKKLPPGRRRAYFCPLCRLSSLYSSSRIFFSFIYICEQYDIVESFHLYLPSSKLFACLFCLDHRTDVQYLYHAAKHASHR